MAKTAEQILKAQGLNDADIAAMSTLLSDPRYRAAIETPFNNLETERDSWKTRSEEFEQLRETEYVPAVTKAEQDAAKARLEAAQLREQIAIAKSYGYLDSPEAKEQLEAKQREEEQRRQQNNGGGFNAEDPKFRDYSGRFAIGQGKAMAMYVDIASQHQRLFGQPLDNFEALYDEFLSVPLAQRQSGTSIKNVWEKKYNVEAKRGEVAKKAEQEREDAIRRDEREKIALQQPMNGNPMTGRPLVSNAPFIRTPDPAKGGQPEMPWDRPAASASRIERAYKAEVAKRVN